MLQTENPFVWFAFVALLVAALVVYPFVKTRQIRITPPKILALVVALGIATYGGTPSLLLFFLWPLSLIWFPEYWGNYVGFMRGLYINEKSPPIVVSSAGWFFLTAFPLLILWIMA